MQFPTDDMRLDRDIQVFADQLKLSNTEWLDFDDYKVDFVKDGIRDGIYRTITAGSKNVRLVDDLRKLLKN